MHNAQLMNPQTSLQVTKTRPYIWPVWAVWQWEMSIANMLPKMTVWSASLTCYQILIKNLKSWKKYCYCSRRLPETIISNGKFVIRKKFACSCLLFRRMWWVHYIVHIEFLWFGLWFTQRPHRYLTKEWMLFNIFIGQQRYLPCWSLTDCSHMSSNTRKCTTSYWRRRRRDSRPSPCNSYE